MTSPSPFTESERDLQKLLDLSKIETLSKIAERFRHIAQTLLYDYRLCVECDGATTEFQLLEIEFYLYSAGIHEDPFCHAHNGQSIPGQWYFHRAGKANVISDTSAGGYRGGTRKGLDLTFGASFKSPFFSERPSVDSNSIRGGILFRSMKTEESGKTFVISGPCLIVEKILLLTQSRNIAELVRRKLSGSLGAFKNIEPSSLRTDHVVKLYLKNVISESHPTSHFLYCSPRIGLDLSHPSVVPYPKDPRVSFVAKLYRFFTHPELLKANGKCNTLIGLLVEEFPEGLSKVLESFTDRPIRPILAGRRLEIAIKSNTLERYIDDLVDGFSKRSLSEFVGLPGKNAASNPRTFMRMMGVLARIGVLKT